jgi:hypothetical protein
VGKNNVLSSFLLQLCKHKHFLTMNQQLQLLEKQCSELLTIIKELGHQDSLSAIDQDLLKQHCVRLYEKVLVLSHSEQLTILTEAITDQPATSTVKVDDEISSVQQPLFAESILTNDIPEHVEEPKEKQPPTQTEIQNNEIDTILHQQQNITVKEDADPELSLHEKIAHTLEPKANLIDKLSSSIPSLKNAINVNLKIALVNKLFNENTVEYVKAIDRLNSCENIHEAMRYFNELKHQYSWDSEDSNVKELEQLLAKRYH